MVRVKNEQEIVELVTKSPFENRRIFTITAHIDHGKTTMADYLLRRAGLMREQDAGHLGMMDSDAEEQARGITIFTSVVLLAYEYGGKEYIAQINDTPGHISFTGEVSRALRGSDGALILVDALEGMMTQTETNIRLAVGEEKCKPVLFLNKADRLISELRLTQKDFYQRLDKIINSVNRLIKEVAPKDSGWVCDFKNNSVAIGSAKDGWGFNFKVLQDKGLKPDIFFKKYMENDILWLRKNLPLDDVVLQMVIDHLPNPLQAAKYRIPKIWPGDLESDLGKGLFNSDPDGPLLGLILKIYIDPKSFRPTLIGRVFSGTLHAGDSIYLMGRKERQKIKRLGVMEITDILDMDHVPAGNLFAVFGFICPAGETFVSGELPDEQIEAMIPFEQIKYVCEPVVSQSIRAKDPKDVAKVGDVVSKWLMADNTAKFTKNKDSGEYILSGIDPLQIEIITKRVNMQVPIIVDDPIIVYRERITQNSSEFHTKSPNGHNRLLMHFEPMDEKTFQLIMDGKVTADQKEKIRAQVLRDEAGWDAKEARNIWDVHEGNILVNDTHGLQRLDKIKSYLVAAWREWIEGGPLAKEPVAGVKAVFTDATVHEDTAHTGFNEIAGMTVSNLSLCFLSGKPKLFEPIQRVDVKTPLGMEGNIIGVITAHRGQVLNMTQEENFMRITGKLPAAETVGLADEFRSVTSGKALFGYEFHGFEPVPDSTKIIMDIRKRKKLPLELPNPASWDRFIYSRKG
ncbi:MAG: elongation factor EF-2 [Candidatus Lokiarchaeota archaeon]|nr:elongation factor EF-2 [Candidatus Lokiarchaeota archaeon]